MDDPKSSSVFKYIGNQLKQHPEQRCVSQNQCIEQVRQGSSVYIFVSQLVIIKDLYNETNFVTYYITERRYNSKRHRRRLEKDWKMRFCCR